MPIYSLDITEQKVAEEGLREGELQFRTLADAIANLAWIARPDGYIFWYNQRWYEYTGTTFEQMQGWGWQVVHHPETLPSVMERWQASIASGESFEMVFPLLGADKVFRDFLTRVVPLKDDAGKVLRWFGTNTDVDELRQTQAALRESERQLRISQERLKLVQRTAHVGGWEFHFESDQFVWSEEVYAVLERRNIGNMESDFLSLMPYSTDREVAKKALGAAMKRNREFSFQFRIAKPNGEVALIASRGTTFYNQGSPILVGVFIDVTNSAQARLEAPSARAKGQPKAATPRKPPGKPKLKLKTKQKRKAGK